MKRVVLGAPFIALAVVVVACGNENGATPEGATDVPCEGPADCPSNVCLSQGVCAIATTADGVKNGDESDVDCGGASGRSCEAGKACARPVDCDSSVCRDKGDGQGLRCQSPAPDDGAKNGDETDVDCGGARAKKCAEGAKCGRREDCATGVCAGGTCQRPTLDGVKNGTETDVDCGGPTAPPCADGKTCAGTDDCSSKVCNATKCQVPTPTDGVANGLETDVDCGGAGNPKCATDKACKVGTDCASDGCSYAFKCALRRSCTVRFGGDTCGRGEVGQAGAEHESCCATAPVPGKPEVELGKYGVTAGRMRAFLTAVNGDVRGFVKSLRAADAIPADAPMNAAWDPYLPTSFDGSTDPAELAEGSQSDPTPIPGVYTSVWRHVGSFIFRNNAQALTGCFVNAPGTHTYWMTPQVQARLGDTPAVLSQDVDDTKGLQCVNYMMAQAFCLWDGGRLQLVDEVNAAWGAETYPWGATPVPKNQGSGTYAGNRFPTATDASLRAAGSPLAPSATQSIEYANFGYSYEYPNLVGTDYGVFINAPGRLKGRSANGHSFNDGLMEATGTMTNPNATTPYGSNMTWAKNGSFEAHAIGATYNTNLMSKYGKLGLRCAYTK